MMRMEALEDKQMPLELEGCSDDEDAAEGEVFANAVCLSVSLVSIVVPVWVCTCVSFVSMRHSNNSSKMRVNRNSLLLTDSNRLHASTTSSVTSLVLQPGWFQGEVQPHDDAQQHDNDIAAAEAEQSFAFSPNAAEEALEEAAAAKANAADAEAADAEAADAEAVDVEAEAEVVDVEPEEKKQFCSYCDGYVGHTMTDCPKQNDCCPF